MIGRYLIKCTQNVSGIIFIRYAQNKKKLKLNNLNVFGSAKNQRT